jgi:hypothetical protein
MAAFTARWLQIADEYYADLPADLQRQIDARVAELLEDPYGSRTPTTRPPTSGSPAMAAARD